MFTRPGHSPTYAIFPPHGAAIMTPRRLQLGLGLFVALSGAVVFNALYIQGAARLRGPRVELGPSPEAARQQKAGAFSRPLPAAASDNTAGGTETVRAIQRELEIRGYGAGTADGLPSLVTRAAILAYEADHGLPLTAEPSEEVLRAVLLGSAGVTPAAGAASSRAGPQADQLIRTVQQSLIGLGLGPVKVDGHQGDETVRAIRRFEREQGMPETGRISAPMVAKLARLAAQGQVRAPR
jgi:peptidoglycan hydrolase-like protein with peptidoglycan-binding domain